MRLLALSLALGVAACAARAPALVPDHPADPAATSGRLVGPPAIVRAARSTSAPAEEGPDPVDAPAHDHGGAHP